MLKTILTAPVLVVALALSLPAAQPSEALKAAAGKGREALMLVTEPGNPNTERARGILSEAAKQIGEPFLIEMDRTDKANAELVAQYGLAGAPVPLFLVFARNGALAGGVPAAQATPARLAKMFPSPKKAEALKNVQSGNAVLIVASRKGMEESARVMEACASACRKIKGKAVTMQIDINDAAEQAFLSELKVDSKTASPVTLVINQQGSLTGSFTGPVDVGALVLAVAAKAGGCGSTKGCAIPCK